MPADPSLIYLDNNATTRPCAEAVAAMLPLLDSDYANPSSVHRFGQAARHAVDEARARLAALVGCTENELLFTSGGTESINTAVRGLLPASGGVLITSTVEHSATRELAEALAKTGTRVIEIGVDRLGRLDLPALGAAVTANAGAVASLMWANNETGAIWPVDQIAAICRAGRVRLHLDATQAVGKLAVNFAALGIDAASFAGHKFHGPKGTGGLYIRRGVRVGPLLIGGPQERGRRGGTENVPGIVGMGAAASVSLDALTDMPRVAALRDRLEAGILDGINTADVVLAAVNGDSENRLANTTNIGFARLEAEAILMLLSERGICASAGAACSSGSLEPSHVLRAMGVDEKFAHGSIRFSLSRHTTVAEVDAAGAAMAPIIKRLGAVLPVG